MKNLEVTKKVMDEISVYEKKRSQLWRVKFMMVILGLWIGIVWAWISGWVEVGQRGTLDLFQVFFQNVEIVKQYGGEAIKAIGIEMPFGVWSGLAGMCLLCVFVMMEKRKRQVVNKRLSQIKDYEKRNKR